MSAAATEIATESVPACPVCGAATRAPLYRDIVDRLFEAPGRWQIDLCRACEAAYLNPRPTREAIGAVYTKSYAVRKPASELQRRRTVPGLRQSIRAGFLANTHGYLQGVRWWQRALALPARVSPVWSERWSSSVMGLHCRSAGRLLDVGCGLGDFLVEMSRLGWDAEGIELDPKMRDLCQQRGLIVQGGTLESQRYPDDSFDAITAKHVIEHVHDPVQFLEECARILKPDGTLVILTPNLHSLGHRVFRDAWIGLDAPRHLVLFAPDSLRRAAEVAGLQVVRLWSSARPSGFTWRVSFDLRRHGRTPYAAGRSLTRSLAEHASDAVVRLALIWNGSAGDELAMIARKAAGFHRG